MSQVTTSSMVNVRHHLLMLADNENEKTKWVVALNELHRILKRNRLPNRQVRAYYCIAIVNLAATRDVMRNIQTIMISESNLYAF